MKLKQNINIYINKIKDFVFKYRMFIIMGLPFIVLDISGRIFFNNSFVSFFYFMPNMYTIIWASLFIGICCCFKYKMGRNLYILFILFAITIFLTNNVYYSLTNNYFDFSLVEMASEGSSYILDAIINAKIWIYIICLMVIISLFFIVKIIPKRENNDYKMLLKVLLVFTLIHSIMPFLYGRQNAELTWNTWKNKRNVYINFNDNNKSMGITGLYEYTVRNFYITFLKPKETNNEIELNFLNDVFNTEEVDNTNNYTGIFKDKNLIFLQLEGIDDWVLTEDTMPNLYAMKNNAYNFNDHYSYYNGGGSTFNSEFAVNTGYITPYSYNQNAYTFNKNLFSYSMANLFKKEGYMVNAFHMNSSEYYSRGINYRNWGFDNYYGLKDLEDYTDNSYMLDTELIKNETFYNLMFHSDKKFVDYIITYSLHLPFDQTKGVCKMLVGDEFDGLLTEEDCVKIQAKETDDMIGLLLQALKDTNNYDNTAIVVFTDHYLYTLNDITILEKYKETKNNLINKTPFFIWSSNTKAKNINEVTSQLNILPTTLNLFGINYNSNYYIGSDALNKNYKGMVLFSDYSWYDGNVYVDGGLITNNKNISDTELEEKNNYIEYIIKKNDLVLKYDYFKVLANK